MLNFYPHGKIHQNHHWLLAKGAKIDLRGLSSNNGCLCSIDLPAERNIGRVQEEN
ncbi:hypothetical protein [Pseudomonas fragi]|uniref:hypothetical protein n=1 Tax=Pseudomonas fragi TaxID=296 RepID=UPI0028E2DAAE|nr:hypothetical protein [Pseudomonas fragi]